MKTYKPENCAKRSFFMLTNLQVSTLHECIDTAVNIIVANTHPLARAVNYLDLVTTPNNQFTTGLQTINGQNVVNALIDLRSLFLEQPLVHQVNYDGGIPAFQVQIGQDAPLNLDHIGPMPQSGEIRGFLEGALDLAIDILQAAQPQAPVVQANQAVQQPQQQGPIQPQVQQLQASNNYFEHVRDEIKNGLIDAFMTPVNIINAIFHPMQTAKSFINIASDIPGTIENVATYAYEHPIRFTTSVLTGKYIVTPMIEKTFKSFYGSKTTPESVEQFVQGDGGVKEAQATLADAINKEETAAQVLYQSKIEAEVTAEVAANHMHYMQEMKQRAEVAKNAAKSANTTKTVAEAGTLGTTKQASELASKAQKISKASKNVSVGSGDYLAGSTSKMVEQLNASQSSSGSGTVLQVSQKVSDEVIMLKSLEETQRLLSKKPYDFKALTVQNQPNISATVTKASQKVSNAKLSEAARLKEAADFAKKSAKAVEAAEQAKQAVQDAQYAHKITKMVRELAEEKLAATKLVEEKLAAAKLAKAVEYSKNVAQATKQVEEISNATVAVAQLNKITNEAEANTQADKVTDDPDVTNVSNYDSPLKEAMKEYAKSYEQRQALAALIKDRLREYKENYIASKCNDIQQSQSDDITSEFYSQLRM